MSSGSTRRFMRMNSRTCLRDSFAVSLRNLPKKMKTFKRILIVVGIVLLALVVVSQFLPSTYRVERSVVIAAKPEGIFPWLNNLRKWPEWSAWNAAKDPTLGYAYEGAEEGVGAASRWDSKKFGEGSMKISEADPGKSLKFDLAFDHGKYLSKGTITLAAAGEGTKVTWAMDGTVSRNPLDRFFSLMMDSMVGKDFEEGLRNLQAKAEGK